MSSSGPGPATGQINFYMAQTKRTPTASRQPSPGPSAPPLGPQIMTFALQKRPRATRASVPKVRTGCVTCKKRHVKCGEEKPSCKRCLKWQGFCGGYDVPTPSAATSPSASVGSSNTATSEAGSSSKPQKFSRGKDTTRPRAKARRRGSSQSLSGPTEQPTLTSHDPRGIQASWNELISTLGAGFFEETFWRDIVPHLGQENLAVYYASMAIEAVRKLVGDGAKYLAPPERKGSTYDEALTYYGNAMQEMTKPLGTQHNLRATIICCILFACFEVLNGDRKTAIAHIFNGKRMMDELWELSSQINGGSQYGGAPKPIENEIVEVFQRLSLLAWASKGVDSWMPSSDGSALDPGRLSPEQMPNTFLSLSDAGFWWQVIQHHILRGSQEGILSGTSRLTGPAETGDEGNPGLAVDDAQRRQRRQRRRRLEPLGRGAGDNDDDYRNFAIWLARWDSAFQPLFTRSMAHHGRDRCGAGIGTDPAAGDGDGFVQAACLRVQFLHILTFVQSPIRLALERNHDLSGHLGEILHLCGMMLPFKGRGGDMSVLADQSIFTPESMPSFALFSAVIRSQQKRMAQDGYELLLQYVGEEQVWNRISPVTEREDGIAHGMGPMHHEPDSSASSARGWELLEGEPVPGEAWAVDNFMIQDFG